MHRKMRSLSCGVCGLAACAMFLVLAQGCAVGRTNAGGIVSGIELGALPDNASEGITAAAGLVGGLFAGPSGAAIATTGATAVLGLLGTLWGVKKSGDAKAAEESKRSADAAFDEGVARGNGVGPALAAGVRGQAVSQ